MEFDTNKIYFLKGRHWVFSEKGKPELLCPNDKTSMREKKAPIQGVFDHSSELICPDCDFSYFFDVPFSVASADVSRIIKSKDYRKMEIIDIDGIGMPVVKKKLSVNNTDYFVTIQVNKTKRGPQIVIYAGKKGYNSKSQIFVTPETSKMSFDHNNLAPSDIFTKITADFVDGSSMVIKKGGK